MRDAWHFPHTPEPPDFALDRDALLTAYRWLSPLADCPQNPEYHAEGDVLTHTLMVAEALVADPAWRGLTSGERSILFASALLHDIGKPATTREDAGRIVSPGHTRVGARMAQDILYHLWQGDDPPDFATRQAIVGLVRLHGLPVWWLERRDMKREVIAASQRIRLDQLAMIARADVLGRIAADRDDLLARVDLFSEEAETLGCLRAPFYFASTLARYAYLSGASAYPEYDPYDESWGEVVLMSGLPGAGKDTWIAAHMPEAPVIALDDIRREMGVDPAGNQGEVVAAAKERARSLLREQVPFVWNATNVTRSLRDGLLSLLTDYGARPHIVYVAAPWDELVRRNETREHPIPGTVLVRLAKKLDVPGVAEAPNVTWYETEAG